MASSLLPVLGRGVSVPMPVILIGALDGMVMSGIIGLFIGAVLLAVHGVGRPETTGNI
ncbi:MAG: hypothetical protein OQL16_10060 [Gammaproteobacteria bacterium]|nr:hypothetical protein [Gammaproteobacteria bacterium]